MSCPVVEKISIVEQSHWIDYLNNQRWFSGKSREIDCVELVAEGVINDDLPCCVLALIEVKYKTDPSEVYLLPLTYLDAPADELSDETILWRDGAAVIYDDLASETCCFALYDLIANQRSLTVVEGENGGSSSNENSSSDNRGKFVGTQSKHFNEVSVTAEERRPVKAINTDQSNSAIRFGERLFFKLFRKLETGVNPDYEIAQFLNDWTSFDRLPQMAGAIEYHTPDGEVMMLAVLQTWVANQGSAWDAMLADLKRVLDGGDFRKDFVVRLGQRAAELHGALASCQDLPAFAPEAMLPHDLDKLTDRLQRRAKKIFASVEELLQNDPDQSTVAIRDQLTQLLELGPAIDAISKRVQGTQLGAKTRVHGDYHLGQVLCQDHDVIILDFEGEPARPLLERRAKDSPLRDVAGMIRSFSYVTHVGLLKYAEPQAPTAEQHQVAAQWCRQAKHHFWQGYRQTAGDASFLPPAEQVTHTLLEFYLIEKAMSELGYEVNNRPDWVIIPLEGLLELLSASK